MKTSSTPIFVKVIRVLILLLTLTSYRASGQILISLLLGDKLNSDKLEFGLDGGVSVGRIRGLNQSNYMTDLNLGFYFDIAIKKPHWYFHTGVMVKSSMGAKGIPVYSLNNPELDAVFAGGTVTRKLGYFNVPILLKYKFKNNLFVEAGPMVGLLTRATDNFIASIESKEDLNYKLKIRDQFHPLDAGLMGGVGYRLIGGNGMNLSVRYYYGLVDVSVNDVSSDHYNQSFYFSVGIPIGVQKAGENSNK